MQMIVHAESFGDLREIILEHNNKEIRFNVSGYDKKVFLPISTDDVEITKHINQYWTKQPQDKQEKIFECFYNIRYIFDTTYDTLILTNTLLDPIKKLFEEHPLTDLEKWIVWDSDVIIHNRNSTGKVIFEDNYVYDDMKAGTRIQTYTRNDYIGLITMSLALRIMVPIWGEFIYRIRNSVGTNFKEMHSIHLLSKTEIINCPYMDRLKDYINSNIKIDDTIFGAIINGIGTEDYPQWIISLVIVRRLCIGNFSGSNPDINLVTFIFNYIKQKMGTNGTSAFGGDIVRDKFKFYDDNNADDDTMSRTESYKIRQAVSTGDLVAIDYYLSDPYNVCSALDYTISKDLLEQCLETTKVFYNNTIWKAQVTLAQWVMAKVVSPRAFPHLNKNKVINSIAISQAWLWHHGHKELSCLISAIASDNADSMQLGGIDSKSRITREQMDKLLKLYPYTNVRSIKQKTKPANEAVLAIDVLSNELGQRDWILTSNPDHIKEVTGDISRTRYSSPYDIKIKLADLVLDLKKEVLNRLDD